MFCTKYYCVVLNGTMRLWQRKGFRAYVWVLSDIKTHSCRNVSQRFRSYKYL